MYFYYVDVSKLEDNKTKLDLRNNLQNVVGNFFLSIMLPTGLFESLLLDMMELLNQIFHLCLLKFAFLRRVFIQKINLHFYFFAVRITI